MSKVSDLRIVMLAFSVDDGTIGRDRLGEQQLRKHAKDMGVFHVDFCRMAYKAESTGYVNFCAHRWLCITDKGRRYRMKLTL